MSMRTLSFQGVKIAPLGDLLGFAVDQQLAGGALGVELQLGGGYEVVLGRCVEVKGWFGHS